MHTSLRSIGLASHMWVYSSPLANAPLVPSNRYMCLFLMHPMNSFRHWRSCWTGTSCIRPRVKPTYRLPMTPRRTNGLRLLLTAFIDSPNVQLPNLASPKSERVYELRSYEGPTEAYYRNKVDMFNEGDEIGLFKRLGFNAVFYGEVIAGSRMPNLMYLTTF